MNLDESVKMNRYKAFMKKLEIINVFDAKNHLSHLKLGMNNNPDCGAVFFHLSQILLNFLLSKIISPFCARFGKSLLLGLGPF